MTPAHEPVDPSRDESLAERATVNEVRRKAARMRRARSQRRSVWRYLAQVGVLGWTFILPAVGLAALGRWLARTLGEPKLAIAGVLAGIAVGAFFYFRGVQRSLRDSDDSSVGDDNSHRTGDRS